MKEDATPCDSRYQTMHSNELVKCQNLGRHIMHQGTLHGTAFTWRNDHQYIEYIDPSVLKKEKKATEKQVGGDHYKQGKMQVFDVWDAFDLDPYEASAVKYLLRHKKKNGREDIEKAIHYLQVILEKQYGV